jgi:hypothetical protein
MKRKSQMSEFVDECVENTLLGMNLSQDVYSWDVKGIDRYSFYVTLYSGESRAKFLVVSERLTMVSPEEFIGFSETFVRQFASALFDEID